MIADTLIFERLENWLFGTFAALAALLAIVGMYGLISHEVELSTRDIGVRLALGATRGRILAGIYRRVGWMLGGGLAAGVGADGNGEEIYQLCCRDADRKRCWWDSGADRSILCCRSDYSADTGAAGFVH